MTRLELNQIGYYYIQGKDILKDVSYSFEEGKIHAIVGKSGAGKTTLLSLLSQLTKPTTGEIRFDGKDVTKMDSYEYRSKNVGVIFQSFNLLPNLSAMENVILSMDISGKQYMDKLAHARMLLHKVGLDDEEMERRILKLSGGQQQRVAIARALSYDPSILLADEPTGNLDGETQNEIMQIFRSLAYEEKKCIIIVTHSPEVARMADEIYELKSRKKIK